MNSIDMTSTFTTSRNNCQQHQLPANPFPNLIPSSSLMSVRNAEGVIQLLEIRHRCLVKQIRELELPFLSLERESRMSEWLDLRERLSEVDAAAEFMVARKEALQEIEAREKAWREARLACKMARQAAQERQVETAQEERAAEDDVAYKRRMADIWESGVQTNMQAFKAALKEAFKDSNMARKMEDVDAADIKITKLMAAWKDCVNAHLEFEPVGSGFPDTVMTGDSSEAVEETWDSPEAVEETWDSPEAVEEETWDSPEAVEEETWDSPEAVEEETWDSPEAVEETWDSPEAVEEESWDNGEVVDWYSSQPWNVKENPHQSELSEPVSDFWQEPSICYSGEAPELLDDSDEAYCSGDSGANYDSSDAAQDMADQCDDDCADTDSEVCSVCDCDCEDYVADGKCYCTCECLDDSESSQDENEDDDSESVQDDNVEDDDNYEEQCPVCTCDCYDYRCEGRCNCLCSCAHRCEFVSEDEEELDIVGELVSEDEEEEVDIVGDFSYCPCDCSYTDFTGCHCQPGCTSCDCISDDSTTTSDDDDAEEEAEAFECTCTCTCSESDNNGCECQAICVGDCTAEETESETFSETDEVAEEDVSDDDDVSVVCFCDYCTKYVYGGLEPPPKLYGNWEERVDEKEGDVSLSEEVEEVEHVEDAIPVSPEVDETEEDDNEEGGVALTDFDNIETTIPITNLSEPVEYEEVDRIPSSESEFDQDHEYVFTSNPGPEEMPVVEAEEAEVEEKPVEGRKWYWAYLW